MTNEVIVLTRNDLTEIIQNAIKEILPAVNHQLPTKQETELISQSDACELLGITLATLIAWKKQGRIKYTKIGGRVYYSKQSILNMVG